MIMKNIYFLILLISISISGFSQFELSGEFRPRTEYTHGLKTQALPDMEFGLFTSQRTRLNLNFKTEAFSSRISLQDIRVFGITKQLVEADGMTSIHEAWAEIGLCKNTSLRIGRQELVYDDARILGNVGWAQQARSHDLFLFKYENKFKIHAGVALNMSEANLTSTLYNLTGNYKAMQFIWFKNETKSLQYSLLFMNNGMQYLDNEGDHHISYSQTTGTRLAYKKENWAINANFYYQFGKDATNTKLSAYNALLEGKYEMSKKLNFLLGAELLSGGNESGINHAFNPFYGTNHAFNGTMDYYYVSNHLNSVGLRDIYFKLGYKPTEQCALSADFHAFSAESEVIDPSNGNTMSRNLGYELDLLASHKLNAFSTLTIGYSHYLGTPATDVVKGGSHEEISNWAWVMFSFTPVFFSSK